LKNEHKHHEIPILSVPPWYQALAGEGQNAEARSATSFSIPFETFQSEKFAEKGFVNRINGFGLKHKFKLRKSKGYKELINGFKRILRCNITGCQYNIIFKSAFLRSEL